jgi:hypothetical protein
VVVVKNNLQPFKLKCFCKAIPGALARTRL